MGDKNIMISLSAAILLLIVGFYACSKTIKPTQTQTDSAGKQDAPQNEAAPKQQRRNFAGSHGGIQGQGEGEGSLNKNKGAATKSGAKYGFGGQSRSFSSSYGSQSGSEAKTKAQKRFDEALKIALKKAKERQNEILQADLEAVLKDPNANPKLKEHCRLISNKSYVAAVNELRVLKYEAAAKSFAEVLKDKEATPVMKYTALCGIRECACKLGNLDLFIATIRQLGLLIKNEDLSLVDVDKDDALLKWVDKFEMHMRARTDPSAKAKLVDYYTTTMGYSQKFTELRMNQQIEQFEISYPEFAL